MSNTLWLINPHKRGTTGATASMKKQRTAKQIAATQKMLAARKKSLAEKAKNAAHAAKYDSNPVKPLKAKHTYSKSGSTKTATTKKVYKRNPIGKSASVQRGKGMFQENIKPAALGAAAALGFDIVWQKTTQKIGLSPKLTTGNMQYPVKILGALALGVAAEKFLPTQYKKHATTLVRGPLTVIMHDFAYKFAKENYPSLGLAEYEQEQALAEILHNQELNGYYDEPYPVEQVGENLRLEGLADNSQFYVPQYGGVSY